MQALARIPLCYTLRATGTNELAEEGPKPGYTNKCPTCAVFPARGFFLAAREFIQSPPPASHVSCHVKIYLNESHLSAMQSGGAVCNLSSSDGCTENRADGYGNLIFITSRHDQLFRRKS